MFDYTEPPERVAHSEGDDNPALAAFAGLDDFLAQLPETGPATPNEDGEKEQLGAVTAVHRFVDAPGDSETVRWHFVESGDPSNPTVVFLHGVPDSWWQWHYALEHLSDRYHCVAIDLKVNGFLDKIRADLAQLNKVPAPQQSADVVIARG